MRIFSFSDNLQQKIHYRGRYAQNQPSYVHNHCCLSSIDTYIQTTGHLKKRYFFYSLKQQANVGLKNAKKKLIEIQYQCF